MVDWFRLQRPSGHGSRQSKYGNCGCTILFLGRRRHFSRQPAANAELISVELTEVTIDDSGESDWGFGTVVGVRF